MTPGAGIEELLVLKGAALFLCARPDGDIRAGSGRGEGLYSDDTRYLSEMRVHVGGVSPLLLSSTALTPYEADVTLSDEAIESIPSKLSIHRSILLADRLYQQLEIRNHGEITMRKEVEVRLAADFADMFEVRGLHKRKGLRPVRVSAAESKLGFAYLGEDGMGRETMVEATPGGQVELDPAGFALLRWPLELGAGDCVQLQVTVEVSLNGSRARKVPLQRAREIAASNCSTWIKSCTGVDCDSAGLERVLTTSLKDIKALVTPSEDGEMIAAGIPWYVAAFGRDALVTGLEMLAASPEPALLSLRHLARLQSSTDDPYRDAEPGKILHEQRRGELARSGSIPHTPYYGTVDATALFIMLAAAYRRWTGDLDLVEGLEPALAAALSWIDDYGDLDGDGFVEYLKRSPLGLQNHGWKDSKDSIIHAGGTRAEGSIALVEVQGYVYAAKREMAEIYRALGRPERAAPLEAQAGRLRDAFNDAFWMPAEDTYALALDGRKRQVKSVTSNPGHCLYCGIVDGARVEMVADRLLARDMFSGWGIRTLSNRSVSYNPASYHNGSIWPHDNALIAAGFKACGLSEQADCVATAMFEAALEAQDARLPELFCGYDREEEAAYVPYPVACRPQAWSAAAPFMLLQSMLGISADASARILNVFRPRLPCGSTRLLIRGMQVGDARVDLEFTGSAKSTECRVFRTNDLQVSIRE